MSIAILVCFLVVFVDQLSKLLIYGTVAHSVIGNFLWFQSTLNTGVAFSMFEGKNVLLAVVTAIACLVLLCLLFSKSVLKFKIQKISIALILGGTFSNLLDRFMFGGVRDFIYLKFINYAIFNVADMAVVCGVIILCVSVIVQIAKDTKNEKSKNNAENLQKEEVKLGDADSDAEIMESKTPNQKKLIKSTEKKQKKAQKTEQDKVRDEQT